MNNLVVGEQSINIYELIGDLNSFMEFRELTKFQVTEQFPKNGVQIYKLYNLKAECEDDCIYCDDTEGILKENDIYVLNAFLVSSIVDIIRTWVEGSDTYKVVINFKNGSISVQALLE